MLIMIITCLYRINRTQLRTYYVRRCPTLS